MSTPERPSSVTQNDAGVTLTGEQPDLSPARTNGPTSHEGLVDLLASNVFPADMRPENRGSSIRGIANAGVLIMPGESKWQATILNSYGAYVRIMTARGASDEELAPVHKRFSDDLVRFHNAGLHSNKEIVYERAQAELDLMLRSSFDADLSTLERINLEPQKFRNLRGMFAKAGRSKRIAMLEHMQKDVRQTLITAFPRLTMLITDLSNRGVDVNSLEARFNSADEAEKARITKQLLSQLEISASTRITAEADTLRALLIDQGVNPTLAERESLTLTPHDQSSAPPERTIQALSTLRLAVDAKLLEQFDANVDLWTRMNGGRKDIAVAQRRSFDAVDDVGKSKQARKLYSRIRGRLRYITREHLERHGKVLRNSGVDGPLSRRRVQIRDARIANSSTVKQFEMVTSL